MARQISRAEAWEKAHEIFTQVNFNSFDYNSVKESLLDYTKLYFPEIFNDYIESSEFIAVLELFAYMSELLAYRFDVNAHENIWTLAQRKESILRLAKFISYKASRNIPARGLVKIMSIQTSETVLDSQNRNLANRRINWNDANNSDWKEQFLLVINKVLEQNFGTVAPNERVQVDDVLFELYTFNNNPLTFGSKSVFPTSATVSGDSFPLELVPVSLTKDGPSEKRPEVDAKFSLLYASDGLGDASDTTGFLVFIKQGTLQRQQATFDGITPNQTYDITITNINDTDLWVSNVDANTRQIIAQDPFAQIFPHLTNEDMRFGEWVEVDTANAQNIVFNTNKNRRKYEVETLDNDSIRLVFGDGEFSDIPSGAFDIWFRTSANQEISIPKNSVINKTASFTYNDIANNVQTITFTYSLIGSLLNASPSETLEHIRRVGPGVYYTQDRMVNGPDYNTFPLQDPSILKLRTINRTFAGDSKYIAWHDPRENYEDVKIFGDDLALYWNEQIPTSGGLTVLNQPITANQLLTDFIEPLLSQTDFFAVIGPLNEELEQNPGDIRRTFNNEETPYLVPPSGQPDNEIDAIVEALNLATTTQPIIDIYYSVMYDEWTVGIHPCEEETSIPPDPPVVDPGCIFGPAESLWMIRVEAQFEGSNLSGWNVRHRTKRLIAQSEHTRFWNTNNIAQIQNFDTLNSDSDSIIVLKANENADRTSLLDGNVLFDVLGQELVEQNLPNAGLPDIHKLSILPQDLNDDNIPDNLLQPTLFDLEFEMEYDAWVDTGPGDGADADSLTLPMERSYLVGHEDEDIEVLVQINGVGPYIKYTFADGNWELPSAIGNNVIATEIVFTGTGQPVPETGDNVKVNIKDYVYFSRETSADPWIPQEESTTIKLAFIADDAVVEDERRFKRHAGRYPLNFAWFHFTPRMHLIDPSPTNIHDMYIVTRGYYTSLVRWLENKTDVQPDLPTPLQLRNSYASLLNNKMISDTVIMHPGKFKILFGDRATPELRVKFKIIRPTRTVLTDNEVKVRVVNAVRRFFNINFWEFGEGFFFTELSTAIHAELGSEINSVVLVPTFSQNQFGDLFQIQAREDELFIPDINTNNVEIVQAFTPENLRQSE